MKKKIKDMVYVSDNMTIGEFRALVGTECWVVDDEKSHQEPELVKAFVVAADITYINQISGGAAFMLWVAVGYNIEEAAERRGIRGSRDWIRCWGFAKTPEAAIKIHNLRMDARKLSNKDIKARP